MKLIYYIFYLRKLLMIQMNFLLLKVLKKKINKRRIKMKIGNTSDYIAFNSYGGFTKSGDEYHILNTNTPLPWCNIMANEKFGTIISSYGTVYTKVIEEDEYIKKNMDIFIPKEDSVKIQYITLENTYGEKKSLNIEYKLEPTLGVAKETNSNYILCKEEDNTMIFKNLYSIDFSNCQAFEFVTSESENILYSFDILTYTLKINVNIEANSKEEFAIILGATDDGTEYIENMKKKYSRIKNITNELSETKKYWKGLVKKSEIKTGDKYLDIMENGWLLYQTIVCRLFARSGFYQSGGAIGFRDQLQDSMALISTSPEFTRKQIILNSSKQFEKGDVLHWWHNHNSAGIRTYFSDDYLWLPYVLSEYVEKTKDYSILDVKTKYLEDKLMGNKRELYEVFHNINNEDSVYEHAKKAILYGQKKKNTSNGLLDSGDGDWNGGFSNIHGQSVWLTFFMMNVLDKFKEVANYKKDIETINTCSRERHLLKHSIIENCWDKDHFIRAFFENVDVLGAYLNKECN